VLFLQLAHLLGVVLMIQAGLAFFDADLVPSQAIVFVGTAITLVVLSAWRLLARPAVWNAIGTQKLIFAGSSPATEQLARAFRTQPSLGMEVAGYIGESADAPYAVPVLGGFADLRKVVAEARPDKVIVSSDNLRDKGILKVLFDLRASGTTVETAGDVYEAIFGRVYSRGVEPYTVIFRNELSAPAGNVALQSIYTNVLALAAVALLVPVIVLISVLLKVTRGGDVFYKNACVGLHGIPFHRYRFRCDTADLLSRMLLRFKLDALPQILNIIRGEMALIGPRPERIEFSEVLDRWIPFYRQKQSVKPGVIGWSQLHCDSSPTEDSLARLEYDLYYLKHISLVLDMYTVIRAVKWIFANPETDEEKTALHDAAA
jgi:lipopolysaccharide/colanic/teichoic acid biosynthesis glycosyltransferase